MMRPFLSGAISRRFDRLARPGTLLAFDYDGTLAPLVPDRRAAVMLDTTAELFALACTRYPCVVISGRARDDVAARLGTAEPLAVVGNHGAEAGGPAPQARVVLMQAIAEALQAQRLLRSLDLEDKQQSLALHLPDLTTAVGRDAELRARRVLQAFDEQIRVIPGHRVLNVVPIDADDKGAALERLASTCQARRVLYIGDDVTDEDVFALRARWLTSVRIGFAADSRARYYLAHQADIDLVLSELARRRPSQHQR